MNEREESETNSSASPKYKRDNSRRIEAISTLTIEGNLSDESLTHKRTISVLTSILSYGMCTNELARNA